MHEFLHFLADASSPAPPDNSVKIAIITAISVVLAAAITGFATTFHRHKDDEDEDGPSTQVFIAELLRRAEVAERHVDALQRRNDSMATRVDDLERLCWQNGLDPNTGEAVLPHLRPDLGGNRNGTAPT